MPITLAPSRRRFLAGSLAASVGLMLRQMPAWAVPASADPNRFALFSDTHVNADPTRIEKDVNMTEHLQRAVAAVIEEANCSAVFIAGDIAHSRGYVPDYKQILSLLDPLFAAGLPIHMTMGNHDDRDNFWEILPSDMHSKTTRIRAIDQKHALAFDTPHARWILLDTMEIVHQTPGLVGDAQLAWLKADLDAHTDKPVLVMMHHDPLRMAEFEAWFRPSSTQPTTAPTTQPRFNSLKDTDALLDILLPRKQVKALFYGHTHLWAMKQEEGMHIVNLPAVSYVFRKAAPSAWVDCKVAANSMELQLRCLRDHPQDKERTLLTWR